MATDGTVGFWLIHSVPKLPDLRGDQYFYSGSDKFGQTLLCLSLAVDSVEQVAVQLQTAHPIIYGANIPQRLGSSVPTLRDLAAGQFGSADSNIETLRTRGVGHAPPLQLTSFIKSPLWGANVYEQVTTTLSRVHTTLNECIFEDRTDSYGLFVGHSWLARH